MLRELNRRFTEHVPSTESCTEFLDDEHHVVLVAGELHGFRLAYVLDRIDGRTAAFLYEVGVDESARRRGLGRALVEEAKRIGKDVGAFEMYVLTEPENEPANSLYASTGATSELSAMWTWTLD